MRTLTLEGIEFGDFILIASIHLWNQSTENFMSLSPLGLVSIKPITTTATTNFESKQSDWSEGWLLNLTIALFLCRGRGICRVMETRLQGVIS